MIFTFQRKALTKGFSAKLKIFFNIWIQTEASILGYLLYSSLQQLSS